MNVLLEDAFAGPLPAPDETGISPIFRGKIRVSSNSLRCYIKPMNSDLICPKTGTNIPNREFVNEALGYVLARSAGLPVSSNAGIILLKEEQIPLNVVTHLRSESGKAQDSYISWFSEDMIYPSIKSKHLSNAKSRSFYDKRIKRIAQQLKSNSLTPKVIALDEWLANSDRNLGNLLEGPKSQLILIDHGRILNFPNWNPGELGTSTDPLLNKIKFFVDQYSPGWSELLPSKSAQVLAFSGLSVSFTGQGEEKARDVLANFFDPSDVEAVVALVRDRLRSTSRNASAGVVA